MYDAVCNDMERLEAVLGLSLEKFVPRLKL